ncbi:MAG: hypothetical protein WDW36_003843 [Sanguina aurantia]
MSETQSLNAPTNACAVPTPALLITLPVVDSVTNYEKLHRIGEGTYGVVYKARDRSTGEIVALKKVRFDRCRDGVPVTSIRELRVLQNCSHPSIVQLKKVVTGSKADSVFLVFEYCEHDLGRLLDAMPAKFSIAEVKCLMKQLLEAVAYLHQRWTVHRDLKLSNLLYTGQGMLKLCDFGLARYYNSHGAAMTPRVVTLWYRAPEVLLGSDTYDESIDMWAMGCIFGELLRHQPLFPAKDEIQCLKMMSELLGTPTPRIWPGMSDLPLCSRVRLAEQPYNFLAKTFSEVSAEGVALLDALLTYDPKERISAADALRHPFFSERPFPKHHSEMPTFPSSHHQPSAPTQQQQQQQPGATGSAASSQPLFGQHHSQHGRPNRDPDQNRRSHALHGAMPKWRELANDMLSANTNRKPGFGDVFFGGYAERYNNGPIRKGFGFKRRR